jgi:hypothetical protein
MRCHLALVALAVVTITAIGAGTTHVKRERLSHPAEVCSLCPGCAFLTHASMISTFMVYLTIQVTEEVLKKLYGLLGWRTVDPASHAHLKPPRPSGGPQAVQMIVDVSSFTFCIMFPRRPSISVPDWCCFVSLGRLSFVDGDSLRCFPQHLSVPSSPFPPLFFQETLPQAEMAYVHIPVTGANVLAALILVAMAMLGGLYVHKLASQPRCRWVKGRREILTVLHFS